MTDKKKPIRKLWLSLWCLTLVLVIVINCCVTGYAMSWDRVLTGYFGTLSTGQDNGASMEVQAVAEGKYASLEELAAAEKEAALQIVDEGVVLLKNDSDALPLSNGMKVSVFGQTAQMWMSKEKLTNTKDVVFLDSLESAGLVVNGTLRKMYKQSKHTKWGVGANLGNGGIAGTWQIDEVPVSEYKDSTIETFAEYGDAAIVVLTRGGSEGGDLPRAMDRFGGTKEQTYLMLSQNEKDLLAMVGAHFDRVILVLHTTNAMDMSFIDTEAYGIDAVLWVSGTGEDGVQEIGKILVGDVNPSGRTVDTWVYDNLSAPAAQNFGDFRFAQNGELITAITTTVGGTYSYQNYAEGIYVGYKYYETRYEDAVMGTANVGSYDYDATVAYPFGYGLSYTDFVWSDFSATGPDKDGHMTLSVKVTNTGDRAGKDVVECYFQSPYTAYDRENGVEKAAVNLLDFGKTGLLAPGESEILTLTVNVNDMISYDANGARTYILDAGDYYITLARDAHSAVNNVLCAKGYQADGNAAFTARHTIDSLTVKDTSKNGSTVTNLFDDYTLPDAVYLSRSNWSMMEQEGLRYADGTMKGVSDTTDADGTVYIHEISDKLLTELTSEGWEVSGNPLSPNDASYTHVKYSQAGSLNLGEMTGKAFNDPDWDKLLDQMSQSEQTNLVGAAMYTTDAIASIGKSIAHVLDGPQGMIDYVTGGAGYQFTDENMLGATWNKELTRLMADLCSQEFALKGVTCWWSPAVNIHRTAFSGRNFEYYSEDGVFNGLMAEEAVRAAKANGVNCQVKHFFLNDQEANRGANGRVAVFAQEQAMREIYAKPFQMAIENAHAAGVMVSMARIGTRIAPGNYEICTGLLRNEWGMTGAVITDAQSLTLNEAAQALAAGCDTVCTTVATAYPQDILETAGGQQALRLAAKHQLYMEANSSAVEMELTVGFPIYKLLLIAYNVLTLIYAAWATIEILHKLFPEKKIIGRRTLRVIRLVLSVLGLAGLAFLLYMFFTTWLPMLQFAFQTAV